MEKERLVKKEFEVLEWMHKKGYDRRAAKEVAPIVARYIMENYFEVLPNNPDSLTTNPRSND